MAQDIGWNVNRIELPFLVHGFQKRQCPAWVKARGSHITGAQSIRFHFQLTAVGGLAGGGDGLADNARSLAAARAFARQHDAGEQT